MPLRYSAPGAALHRLSTKTAIRSPQRPGLARAFHVSPPSRRLDSSSSSDTNHYETLNVHPDASPAEIKKSFYRLSKRHHPDHNPSDPHAPSRFMRLSEAYATLSHADKRARYDRDVLRLRHHHTHHTHHHRGSYHSTGPGPAGGRPASGLSSRPSRRGSSSSFQGPPPSFFRSGGWGAHGAKRRAAHEESTGFGAGYGTRSSPGPGGPGPHPPPPPPPPPPPHSPPGGEPAGAAGGGERGGGGGGASRAGGMGPGQDPFGHGGEVPHFDRAAHERAQRRGEERRAQRRAEQKGVRLEPDSSTTMSFFAVAAILAVVVMGPFALSGVVAGPGIRGGSSSAPPPERDRERERERRPR